jgi:hypothetical protein
MIAGAFALEGWSLDLAKSVHRLDGLPLYIYQKEGTAVTKPCAEVLLSERVVEALEETGLVPLVSYRDTDMVVQPCIQWLGVPLAIDMDPVKVEVPPPTYRENKELLGSDWFENHAVPESLNPPCARVDEMVSPM